MYLYIIYIQLLCENTPSKSCFLVECGYDYCKALYQWGYLPNWGGFATKMMAYRIELDVAGAYSLQRAQLFYINHCLSWGQMCALYYHFAMDGSGCGVPFLRQRWRDIRKTDHYVSQD